MIKNWKTLLINIAIPLAVGGLAAFITRNSMDIYKDLDLPPLAPPGFLFPIVWTMLYFLMGVSSYIVYTSKNPGCQAALWSYGIQLALNFIWSLVFFLIKGYLAAFIIILILLYYIGKMVADFMTVNKTAGYLQLPYLFWVIFATYLNFGIVLLN